MSTSATNTVTAINPAAPSETIGTFPTTSESEIREIFSRARSARYSWSRDPLKRSASLKACSMQLRKNEEQLIDLMIKEVGKPFLEAKGELERAISILDYYSSASLDPQGETFPAAGSSLLFTTRTSYGVAGLITPWNFPLAIPIWKTAPALACGNSVVIKPSEYATATALKLGQLLNEVLPPGVFSIVTGYGEEGSKVTEGSDIVSFTGSFATGTKVINRANEIKVPVQAEMGGSNAAIVFPDTELDQFVTNLVTASFSYSGQKCTATRKVIAVGNNEFFNEVRERLFSAANSLKIGDPRDKDVFVGPLVNMSAKANFQVALETAQREGAEIFESSSTLPSEGWFVKPTFTSNLNPDSQLFGSEVFGPLVHLVNVGTLAEAAKIANSSDYGLTASIHTSNLKSALELASQLETGIVKVNAPTAGVDFYAPFGGHKDSSFGMREQGKAALDFYSYSRTIFING